MHTILTLLLLFLCLATFLLITTEPPARQHSAFASLELNDPLTATLADPWIMWHQLIQVDDGPLMHFFYYFLLRHAGTDKTPFELVAMFQSAKIEFKEAMRVKELDMELEMFVDALIPQFIEYILPNDPQVYRATLALWNQVICI